WNQIYEYDNQVAGSGVTFEAILQLNTGSTPGDITFNYPDLLTGNLAYDNGASATVGIRANGSAGTKLVVEQNSGSNALVASLKAVKVSVPKVASITRLDASTISAGDADFQVNFSEGVTGVDSTDFTLTATGGVTGASINHVQATPDPKV